MNLMFFLGRTYDEMIVNTGVKEIQFTYYFTNETLKSSGGFFNPKSIVKPSSGPNGDAIDVFGISFRIAEI